MKSKFSFNGFQAIIDNAAEGIITIDTRGMIRSMNPSAEVIFGYDFKEVINKNIKILVPEPYKNQHDNYISKYKSTQESKIIGTGREVVGLRSDGQEFPMWLSVSEFHEDGEQYFTGFISDLSVEKSNLQRALNYEHILENSLNEIYIFDQDTLKFIHANKSALLNLQYSLVELKNKTPIDIKPDFTNKKFKSMIAPLINDEVDKIIFTTRHQRKDGSIYPIEVHLELSEYQNKIAFVAIILDISERVSAQEKERINEEKLAHMDRVSIFGEMAAGIAHEINQPLTAISAYASAGLRRIDSEEINISKLKDLFEKISTATQRTNDVIMRLKKMLKPMSKMIDCIDINKLIRESIDIMKIDTRSNKFEFILLLSGDLPKAVGDVAQLQQVILNLVRNSIDASIDSSFENNKIVISSENVIDENKIEISVKDYGSGIKPEIEDNIFAPFQTTKESGMGIGLSICQTIIQAHNGKIWVTKNKDKGVTFHFTVRSVPVENHE